jgi:sigma-B regulation protein RsbU (phosphoserine phosphatase)
MLSWHQPSRPVLLLLAVLFSSVTVLASALWMMAARSEVVVTVELGFNTSFQAADHSQRVDGVSPEGPAEQAGLRVGDRIVLLDGQPIADAQTIGMVWSRHQPGDTVDLTVVRPGGTAPVPVRARFRAAPSGPAVPYLARQVHDLFPVPFVVVGLAVLFLRLEDRNAWLLALLFACFVATPGLPEDHGSLHPALRAFVLVHASISLGLIGGLFYFLFAVFPARSPIDEARPRLKWALIVIGIALALPGIPYGGLRFPPPLATIIGETASMHGPLLYVLGCFALGIASLAMNYRRNPDPGVRRKLGVVFWGTVVGVVPGLLERAASNFTSYRTPALIAALHPAVACILPLSFAYAVVKHRVLEIPVLLKRSARYLIVQRGFTFVLSIVSIGLTLLFASWLTQFPGAEQRSWGVSSGAVFGTCLLWGGLQVHRRVSGRIDRAFFRSAYDARVILEDLADQSAAASDRATLANLLERHLVAALQPVSLVVFLEEEDGQLRAVSATAPGGIGTIPAGDSALPALVEARGPLEPPFEPALLQSRVAALQPECLVPIVLRSSRLAGLLVLGRRLSEEPYSGEDRRLLASVASQAATALDNMALAEEIARRIESERRVVHEMAIARDVQARLLPDTAPPLATLDYAARCIQARSVGGDGYDFLDLAPGRVGFVLADVSGKGIHAALLMANLQAHLRSQCSVGAFDPVRVLTEVNRLLFRSTATQHYATLFFGVYDDAGRCLRYVNCGHNPPVLLGCAGGDPVRLVPTAPAVGLFEQWEAAVAEAVVGPGDLLAVFSDGVTEATCGDEEFGEARFVDALRALGPRPAAEIVDAILSDVQQFSAGTPSDDLTLLVLRGARDGSESA